MIFRVKSNSLLQLSTIKHNRATFQNLIHTFGDLKLKILPQKCILYLFSKLTTWVSLENITFRASLWDVYKMFWGCCGKSYNFETANSLVFQAQIWRNKIQHNAMKVLLCEKVYKIDVLETSQGHYPMGVFFGPFEDVHRTVLQTCKNMQQLTFHFFTQQI